MVKLDNLTPILNQYWSIKKKYMDVLLFYQMGDFYELFYNDAEKISSLLNITLTSKKFIKHGSIPMAGVPVKTYENYIFKLIKLGESVAICNQIFDENLHSGDSNLIKRKVVRIITPGTVVEDKYLNNFRDNFIVSIYSDKNLFKFGFSVLDIISGKFYVLEALGIDELKSIFLRYDPSEIICPDYFFSINFIKEFNCVKYIKFCDFDFYRTYCVLIDHFNVNNLSKFGIENNNYIIQSSGCLLNYIKYTKLVNLSHIDNIKFLNKNSNIYMDYSTIKNLELFNSLSGNEKNTLLFVLDKTVTPMGKRMLKRWLSSPTRNIKKINNRHMIIESIWNHVYDLKKFLSNIGDIERILGRIVLKTFKIIDLINFKNFLIEIKNLIFFFKKKIFLYILDFMYLNIDKIKKLINLLTNSIVSDFVGDLDFGFISFGYNKELDKLHELYNNSDVELNNILLNEIKKTRIKNLSLKYNKVYGYYIQVHKDYYDLVPSYFIKCQTLKYFSRYIFSELKNCEFKLFSLKKKYIFLEKKILFDIISVIISDLSFLKIIIFYLSKLDVLSNFVERSISLNYKKPNLVSKSIINMINGRHPVVENNIGLNFISNNLFLNNKIRLLLITGPNMGGKSTYMRQIAIICIMVYIGCYVPVDNLYIGPIDKILTRIGFSDDISSGKSTFMIEMSDISNIINNATKNSLVLIDEMGRGTSVKEGISLSWSCLNYISKKIKSLTLFSTHYLELTSIVLYNKKIRNFYFDFIFYKDDIVFLYKIKEGFCNRSYGLNVAKKVGIPKIIINNAYRILNLFKT